MIFIIKYFKYYIPNIIRHTSHVRIIFKIS